jgi:phosphohistidine phosphatase
MTAGQLYFMQHAIAANKADNPDRPLTEDGINQTRNIARHLHNLESPITSIFHSGKLRAQQTAEIIATALDIHTVDSTDYLSPNDDVALIIKNLDWDSALYVGHLPHLEKLVSMLVTGKKDACIIQFRNSAMVSLKKNNDFYRIQWYLTPQIAVIHE